MSSTFITESNRGLGREWARQYAMEGWRVFATCRHPAEASALTKLAEQHSTLTIHWLDVTVPEDLRALFRELEEEPIDILLNHSCPKTILPSCGGVGVSSKIEKRRGRCPVISFRSRVRRAEGFPGMAM
jgi:short-subunit dehydrogenase involved in D-alanine esterification of teichoic acids